MLNGLIEKGVLAASPIGRMKMLFPQGKRTRTLTLMELVLVWVATDEPPEPFRSFYQLLILIGQCLREVYDLPWVELDLDEGDWLIPGARTKNKRDHLVPLPD